MIRYYVATVHDDEIHHNQRWTGDIEIALRSVEELINAGYRVIIEEEVIREGRV
jgi:hypothetical protein